MRKIIMFLLLLLLTFSTMAQVNSVKQQVIGVPNGIPVETLAQDMTNPLIILNLGNFQASSTLATEAPTGTRVINVVSAAGMSAGDGVMIYDEELNSIYQYHIVSINVNAITLDMPIGDTLPIGDVVIAAEHNMNVNGSVTPVKFNMKTGLETLNIHVHITRLLLIMVTNNACTFNGFGDGSALTRGVYLRRTDGDIITYFNAKKNLDFNALCYDVTYWDAEKPQGLNGLSIRMTFTNMGSVIELNQDEDLEFWVQDNLTGLVRLEVVVEGHISIN